MKLLPSLKQKKRYVLFEIISEKEKKFSLEEVQEEINSTLKSFWGELGLSRAAPLFIKEKFDFEKQRFLIKVNHKYPEELKAALTLNKKIKNTPVIIKSITTSGTIKKAVSR